MTRTVADSIRLLQRGALDVEGRLVVASNATFLCAVSHDGERASCVYKPVRGERPLWDFPRGSLASREVATYLLAAATGHDLVPPTILRDGPFGEGMCQLWIDHDTDGELVDVVPVGEVPPGWLRVLEAYDADGAEVLLVHADDPQLRLLAAFDIVVNNADRKAGHVIVDGQRRVFGVDHGVCLHEDDKLRTVLWGWAGTDLPADVVDMLRRLDAALDGEVGTAVAALVHADEVRALRRRLTRLLSSGRFPRPSGDWPSIPWPVF